MAHKKVILAIDDNVQQLSEYKNMLSSNYDLRVVKSASEAIAFLNREIADIVLLDIEMPNISGFEFLDDIKKIPSYLNVPILIVSGNSDQEFMQKAKNSKAVNTFTKPVNPDKLIDAINKALSATT
ncbi:MAG: response regulator [Treponema sp.]|nr:response regulator [Treponema sp.]